MAFASVTSDFWVGLDEIMNSPPDKNPLIGVLMLTFTAVQLVGVLSQLIVATAKRILNFVRLVTLIT